MTSRVHCDASELLGADCGASTADVPLGAGWVPVCTRRSGRWAHLCPEHSERAAEARAEVYRLDALEKTKPKTRKRRARGARAPERATELTPLERLANG